MQSDWGVGSWRARCRPLLLAPPPAAGAPYWRQFPGIFGVLVGTRQCVSFIVRIGGLGLGLGLLARGVGAIVCVWRGGQFGLLPPGLSCVIMCDELLLCASVVKGTSARGQIA
jgi:hypothetical protein